MSGPTSGSSPLWMAEGSSAVRSTTSARCRPNVSTAPTSRRQLVSTSTGCRPAIASCRFSTPSRRCEPCSWLRTPRSPATKETRSPARVARVASSSAASIAASSRGASSTRPAEVRPVSRTSTRRRSRSGCQVRTTTDRLRALARQSTLRTSSPLTYSRSESNSVPCPRTRTAARPSSSRSRASRLGRCRIDGNAGSTRRVPGTSIAPCRPARPSGPRVRTVTRSVCRSPRRIGRRPVVTSVLADGARWSRCRLSLAPADGCQASRTTPRTARRPVFVSSSVVEPASPCRVRPTGRRTTCSAERAGASQHVDGRRQRHQHEPGPDRAVLRAQQHRTDAEQHQHRKPPGQRHLDDQAQAVARCAPLSTHPGLRCRQSPWLRHVSLRQASTPRIARCALHSAGTPGKRAHALSGARLHDPLDLLISAEPAPTRVRWRGPGRRRHRRARPRAAGTGGARASRAPAP